MALHQHFGNACGTTKVSVNLEGWVCIEQVGVGASFLFFITHQGQLVCNELVGMVAVEQTRPQANFPSHAPASGWVAAMNEGSAGSVE